MKKNIAVLVFGLLLIFGGIGFVGAEFLGWNFDLFFDGWWTLFIIIPAFVSLLSNGARTSNLIILGIGVVLLLRAQGLISSRYIWIFIVGISLVAIGISLIVGFFRKPQTPTEGFFTYQGNCPPPPGYPQADQSNTSYSQTNESTSYQDTNTNTNTNTNSNTNTNTNSNANSGYTYTQPKNHSWSYDQSGNPNYSAFMSGVTMRNTSQNFEGGRISVVMGGADIDLRDVIINKDITIYVSALMGGIDIYAPKNVRIAISKTDILGGTDCVAYSMPPDANVPVCNFVCTSIMAGIDIK